MKTLNLLILTSLLSLTLGLTSRGDTGTDPAARFAGYHPTVFETDAQINEVFQGMEDGFKGFKPFLFQFGTQCTARAETWSYDLYKTKNIKSEKVFVFYTKAYHEYYYQKHGKPFKWWFHVSPYVLVKGTSGTEERVIDRAFSERPQTMKEWTDLFIESGEQCIENVPYANFEGDVEANGASYNKNAHCYIVRAPMYDMFPQNADDRERGVRSTLEFSLGDVRFAAKSLTINARKKYYERVGL